MKHLLNNLTEQEKSEILGQHTGGKKIMIENFGKLINHKSGDVKTLVNEQVPPPPAKHAPVAAKPAPVAAKPAIPPPPTKPAPVAAKPAAAKPTAPAVPQKSFTAPKTNTQPTQPTQPSQPKTGGEMGEERFIKHRDLDMWTNDDDLTNMKDLPGDDSDWDEEEYDNYDTFSQKYPDSKSHKRGWDSTDASDVFGMYQKKYGNLLVKNKKGVAEQFDGMGDDEQEMNNGDAMLIKNRNGNHVSEILNNLPDVKFLSIVDCEYADFSNIDMCSLSYIKFLNLKGTENNFEEQGFDCASKLGEHFYTFENKMDDEDIMESYISKIVRKAINEQNKKRR